MDAFVLVMCDLESIQTLGENTLWTRNLASSISFDTFEIDSRMVSGVHPDIGLADPQVKKLCQICTA
jgi:hypothetical protein